MASKAKKTPAKKAPKAPATEATGIVWRLATIQNPNRGRKITL